MSTETAQISTRPWHLDGRRWGRWVLGFIGFPLAGLAAQASGGPIVSVTSAVVGGLCAGLVLGGVQACAQRLRPQQRVRWTLSTSFGVAVGLSIGSAGVDYRTDTASLAVMGLATGAVVGAVQAAVMDVSNRRRIIWMLAHGPLWALGWVITAQVINDVDAHYATFGASGALMVASVGGLILSIRSEQEPRADLSAQGTYP
ncbi:MAG: hypothetical protein WA880_00470 [Ornithinimicrobium sp.]